MATLLVGELREKGGLTSDLIIEKDLSQTQGRAIRSMTKM